MPNLHPSALKPETRAGNVLPLRPAPTAGHENRTQGKPAPVLSIHAGFDTIKEFCAFFRISRTTFHKLANEGRVHTVKIGRKTLIPRSERENVVYRLPQPALFPAEEMVS